MSLSLIERAGNRRAIVISEVGAASGIAAVAVQ